MSKAEEREKQIQNAMKSLGLTREEAIEMLEEDDEVERGTVFDWDLSPEEHKKAMKNANTGTKKKSSSQSDKKPRKEDAEKREIIQGLFEACKDFDENAEITNPERVVAFMIGDNEYTITLTRKRKPKDGKTEKSILSQPMKPLGGRQFS